MNLIIKPTDRFLIISPHADDESIGCGGLMLRYGSQGDILLLTDGRKGYDSRIDSVDEDALTRIREEELRHAAALCGIRGITALGIPDGTVAAHAQLVLQTDITGYDYIFVPNQYERHKDHRAAAQLALAMKRQQHARAQIYQYEVWSPIPEPTIVLDLTDVMPRKEELVSIYRSQTKYKDYVRMTRGLNQYRGVGFGFDYAEVYAPLIQKSLLRRLYDRLPAPIRSALHRLLQR